MVFHTVKIISSGIYFYNRTKAARGKDLTGRIKFAESADCPGNTVKSLLEAGFRKRPCNSGQARVWRNIQLFLTRESKYKIFCTLNSRLLVLYGRR